MDLSDCQSWLPFWIELKSLTIKCSPKLDKNCIISQLIPLGKSFQDKKTILNFLVEYKEKDESNEKFLVEYEEKDESKEKFLFLNLDNLISLVTKRKTESQLCYVKYVEKGLILGSKDPISKEPLDSKHRYRVDAEECYFRIADLLEDGDQENELPFFNSNLNEI